jgi:Holliday junction DNA helicase RuvA
MYAYIEGKIEERNPAYVVMDCNGIGYRIAISVNTYSRIKNLDHCRLFTHLAIRNEATTPVGFALYGFSETAERDLFRQLISVSGVGYNTAILILSSIPPDKLVTAIAENNVAALQSVKGIGAKSAQRIIIDLKDKIQRGKLAPDLMGTAHNTNRDEALSGLTVLGFSKGMAEKALDKIIKEQGAELSIEDLIKQALKVL